MQTLLSDTFRQLMQLSFPFLSLTHPKQSLWQHVFSSMQLFLHSAGQTIETGEQIKVSTGRTACFLDKLTCLAVFAVPAKPLFIVLGTPGAKLHCCGIVATSHSELPRTLGKLALVAVLRQNDLRLIFVPNNILPVDGPFETQLMIPLNSNGAVGY